MAEQPQWRAIQPPKLPRFTGEADGCDADEFIQEAERILRNFRMEEGTAMEWLIQALEGSARREVLTRAAGEADIAANVLAVLAATFGDHRDLHAVHRRQRQMCIRDSSWLVCDSSTSNPAHSASFCRGVGMGS